MENIVLQGERYQGVFSLEKRKTEVQTGSCYTRGMEDAVHWIGAGEITDLRTNEKRTIYVSTIPVIGDWFLEKVPEFRRTPEGSIVYFDKSGPLVISRYYVERPPQLTQSTAVDIALEKILEEAGRWPADRIPFIEPKPIDVDDLDKLVNYIYNK